MMSFLGLNQSWFKNLVSLRKSAAKESRKTQPGPRHQRKLERLALEVLEDRIAPALQVVNLNTLEVFATGATSLKDAIQDTDTLAGHTLEVYGSIIDGGYDLSFMTVNKAGLVIQAAAGAAPVIDSFTGIGALIEITAANVELRGLRVSDISVNGNLTGINITSTGDGVKIINCVVDGMVNSPSARGINLGSDADNVQITGSTITSNIVGVRFQGGASTDNLLVANNFITANTTDGLQFQAGFTTSGGVVRHNQISGNTVRNINNLSATTINASQNWWNTTTAATILATFAGAVDFTPYLHSGDADGGTAGFQADLSYLHVTSQGSQVGSTGRIQEAVDALADGSLTAGGRLIQVSAGRFAENVVLNKALTLRGAQFGVSADTRQAAFIGGKANITIETELTADTNNPTGPNPGAEDLVRVTANNVTIDGLVIDGNNASLGASSIVSGGFDIHARRGITNIGSDNSFNPVNNLLVQYNVIQNVAQRGISLANDGPVSTGNLIYRNHLRNWGSDPVAGGQGIILFTNAYADIDENTLVSVTDSTIGLHLQNFFSNGTMTWSDNNITVGEDSIGIHSNLFYAPAGVLNITNNTVNAALGVVNGNDYGWGINVWTNQVGSTVNLTNNTVGSSSGTFDRGINLWHGATSVPVTVSGGSVGNSVVGLAIDNVDVYYGAAPTSTFNVSNLAISGGQIGIRVRNAPLTPPPLYAANVPAGSVQLNLTGGSITGATTGILVLDGLADTFTAGIQFLGGTVISGGTTGLMLDGAETAIVGATLGNLSFSGQTGNYITLANSALDNTEINALAATFGGLDPDSATPAQNFAIEDKIQHALDAGTLGHIRFNTGEVFVTALSGSIQRGVDAATAGNTVHVQNSTYDEAVLVDKSVTLLGDGAPTLTRTAGANQNLITIAAANVTIDGFDLQVNRPFAVAAISSVVPVGAGDEPTFDGALIQNNTITSLGLGGVYTSGTSLGTQAVGIAFITNDGDAPTVTIRANTFVAGPDPDGAGPLPASFFTRGIWMYGAQGTIGGATLADGNNPFGLAWDVLVQFAPGTTTIRNNSFGGRGIDLNGNAGATINVLENTFTQPNGVAPLLGASDFLSSVFVRANEATVNITNNDFLDVQENSAAIVSGSSKNVTVSGNDFTAESGTTNYTFVLVTTGYTSSGVTPFIPDNSITIQSNNFNGGAGGATGRAIDVQNHNSLGGFGTITIGGVGFENTFDYETSEFIRLAPGLLEATFTTPNTPGAANVNIDARFNFFDVTNDATANAILPSAMSLAQRFALEDRLLHRVDVATVGLITVVAGELFVTTNSFLAPFTTFADIQRAIDAATAGNTIHVAAGTYDQDLDVNKAVTLLGAGAGSSVLRGQRTGNPGDRSVATVFVSTNNVVVAGFTITREGNTAADWNASLNTAGVAIQTVGNATIRDNLFTGNRTGIDINDSDGNLIHNNVIDFNRTGILLRNDTLNNLIFENQITNNWTLGVLFIDGGTGNLTTGTEIFNNNISGNWYGDIENRVPTGTVRDFSGNWFGTTTPTTATFVAATEPGYAGQIPVAFGGAASNPGGSPNIKGVHATSAAAALALIDFSPFLAIGTDTNIDNGTGTYGFQGDFSTLWVTPVAGQTGGPTYSRIQEGYDLVSAGGTVRIISGTYDGDVTTAAKAATLAPGGSPGQVVINGNLVLTSAITLAIEINGLTPGTQHDQFVVNGTINLGNATVSLTRDLNVFLPPGSTFTIFDNDAAEAITGTFSNSSPIVADNLPFTINYAGGINLNDVVFEIVAPNVVWVNDNWTIVANVGVVALSQGDIVDPSGGDSPAPSGLIFGYNAFATIQSGIDAVIATGIVNVVSGTYLENVIIDKAVSLLGSNAGLDPNVDPRIAEAVLRPGTSDPEFGVMIYIEVSNVIIDGLTLDGDNTSINSTILVNGVDVDAGIGIASYEGVGNIQVQNNIVRNLGDTGLFFYNYTSTAATSNNYLRNNLLDNIGHIPYGYGVGVLIYNNFYANITDNVMTNVRIGVQTGNFEKANVGATSTISGNDITSTRLGIWHNLAYSNASPLTITGNTLQVSNETGAVDWAGIFVSSIQGTVSAVISSNTIDATGAVDQLKIGVLAWNNSTTSTITILGGSITNADYGVWVNNYEAYADDGDSTTLILDGVSILNSSTYGVYASDDALNGNNATVAVQITNNTDISGAGSTGVYISGSDASATISNNLLSINGNAIGIDVDGGTATISTSAVYDNATGIRFRNSGTGSVTGVVFTGAPNNDTDVRIDATAGAVTFGAGNAFAGDDYYIDNRSSQNFNLVGLGSTFDFANNFRIEDHMYHALDNLASGLITWVSATRFVSAPGTGASDETIQRAATAANANDTIFVEAGTYLESVQVTKALTILGAQWSVNPDLSLRTPGGALESTVVATGAFTPGFDISASGVTIRGFSITQGAGGIHGIAETTAVTGTNVRENFIYGFTGSLGVAIAAGSTAFQVVENQIFSNYAGVYLSNNAANGSVSGNIIRDHTGATFTDDGSGIVFEGINPGITVNQNQISGNRHGVYVWTGFGSNLTGTTVFENSITGSTVFGVLNTNAASLDASTNWWGTYVAAAVGAQMSGLVDYTPWFHFGTDGMANHTRFTADFSHLHVDDNGQQTSGGRIQEAIGLLANGSLVGGNRIIDIEAGTFDENVIADKAAILRGAGQANTFVRPSFSGANTGGGSLPFGHSSVFLVRSDDVTIRNLTIDGDNPGLVSGIVVNGADLDARNGIITDHTFTSLVLNLNVTQVTVQNIFLRGIYASTDFGTFSFTNNIVTNVAGDPQGSVAIFNFGGSGTISGNQVSQSNDGIATNWSAGTVITGNTVSTSGSGIHSDNNGGFGGPAVADTISGNTVQNGGAGSYGVWVFAPYLNVLVTNNIVNNVEVGLGAFGGFGGSPMFTLNTVDNNNLAGSIGAYVSNTLFTFGHASVNATIDNDNTFTNADTGIYVEQVAGGSTTTVAITNNSASIYGNVVGIDVAGGTATITGNSIYDNGTGIRFTTTGGGSVANNEFRGAGGLVNDTDLRLDATAGAVTIGNGNSFAGGGTTLAHLTNPFGFYIDNQSTTSHNLVGSTNTFWYWDGSAYVQLNPASTIDPQNFRIEDRILHGVDNGTSGRIIWQTGWNYVSVPGTGASAESIPNAIAVAAVNDTVFLERGTHTLASTVQVNKPLTIRGEGTTGITATTVTSLAGDVFGFVGINAPAGTVNFEDFRIANGLQAGIRYNVGDGPLGTLNLDGMLIEGNDYHGLSVFGTNASPLIGMNVNVIDTTFNDNGTPASLATSLGFGDVLFFNYNGNASLTNVVIDGMATDGANNALQFRGSDIPQAAGTLSLTNVAITGSYLRPTLYGGGLGTGILIQTYASVAGVTFSGVNVNLASGIGVAASGLGTTLNLGNTSIDVANPLHFYIATGTSSFNNVPSNINATNTTLGGIAALTANLPQLFDMADRVADRIDVPSTLPGQIGMVMLRTGNIYVTPNSFIPPFTTTPRIQRGVDAALIYDAVPYNTIHVEAGSYAEAVTIDASKNVLGSLTILGAQSGVNPDASLRTAGGAAESTVAATGGSAFTIGANNVTIRGFSVTNGVGGVYGIAENTAVTGTVVRENFVYGLSALGIAIAAGSSSFQILDNNVFNNYAGIYFSANAFNGTASGNYVHSHAAGALDQGAGFVFEGNNTGILVTENEVTGNDEGVYVWHDGIGGTNFTGTSVSENRISGNTLNVSNTNSGTLDASSNWWGSNVLATVTAGIAGLVDYSPFLDVGTDGLLNNTRFQGSFATLWVHDAGQQIGAPVYSRIQEGYDLVDAGGTVRILSGTYAGDVTTGLKVATLSPGASPASVAINGNVVLTAAITLALEINGTIAGTDYDQFVVTGTINLGNATVSLTRDLNVFLPVGSTFTIFDNDAAEAITGTFSNASPIVVANLPFTISYAAGTNLNDVVFSIEAPNVVWVNDTWTIATNVGPGGLSQGDLVDPSGGDTPAPLGLVFGYNAFATIQTGVNAVAVAGTVNVVSGAYAESVSIAKSLSLLGAQNGVNPSAFGGRTAGGLLEATVSAGAGQAAFSITNSAATNVMIDGFSLTTATTGTSGIAELVDVDGTYVRNNFIYGFSGYGIRHAVDSINFQDRTNQIYNNLGGIYAAENSSASPTGATIRGNWIHTNTQAGLLLEGRHTSIDILENQIDGHQYGIRIIDVGVADDLQGVVVFNNSITNSSVRALSNELSGPGTILLDASGNWFGINSLAGVLALVSSNVDFSPWLDAGTDSNAGTAFQGDFSTLNVSSASPPVAGGHITEAIGLLADGALVGINRVIHVLHGTYTENVNAAVKDFTFAFGNGTTQPGTVSVIGNVTFDAGNRLRIRLNGNLPGNGVAAARFDRLSATGTVDLGGVVVEGTRTYIPVPAEFFDIVTGGSVIGAWGNASVVLTGVPFNTSVTATTGRLDLPLLANTWVNDTWVRIAGPGAPVYGDLVRSNFLDAGNDPNVTGLIFGVSAFDTLAGAHAALVTSGGTISVLTGTYGQSLNITKNGTTFEAVIGTAPVLLNPAAGNVLTLSGSNITVTKSGGADRLEILGNGTANRTGILVTGTGAFIEEVKVTNFSGTNSAGIRVNAAGSAQLLNNISNDNQYNVHVNGGTARLQGNDLRNYVRTAANVAGLLVSGNALVDAGMQLGDASFTGFAISSGGNQFNYSATPGTGYWMGGPQAIVNLNIDSFVTPSGAATLTAPNVAARGNDFGTTNYGNIEQIVNHHLDNNFLAWVDYRNAVGAVAPQLVGTPTYYAVGPTDDLPNQRSIIRGVEIVFDSPVNVGAGAFGIVRDLFSTNFGVDQTNVNGEYFWYPGLLPVGAVPLNVASAINGSTGRTTVTITFDTGALPSMFDFGSLIDGNYTTNLDAAAVDLLFASSGTQFNNGTDYSQAFHRFFGDLNGDTLLDGTEAIAMTNALNVPFSPYRKYLDFNNSNSITALDQFEFDQRFALGILP